MPDDGIVSLADAFGSAESELGLADPSVEATTQPVVESNDASAPNTTEVVTVDNPDEEAEPIGDTLEGFEDLFDGDVEESTIDTSSPEFLQTRVTIDTVEGPQAVTIEDLQKGYLRQADYTRKTQEVAEQRRAAHDAVEFYETWRKDPMEFARTLAIRAGYIQEGAEPVKPIEVAKFPTPESIQEMVEQQVQERLAADPSIKEAKLIEARKLINESFDGVEKQYGLKLNDKQRQAVLREATQRGTTDIPLVFEAMYARYQAQQSRRPSAPARPTGSAAGERPAAEATPNSLVQAFEMAEAELAGS